MGRWGGVDPPMDQKNRAPPWTILEHGYIYTSVDMYVYEHACAVSYISVVLSCKE